MCYPHGYNQQQLYDTTLVTPLCINFIMDDVRYEMRQTFQQFSLNNVPNLVTVTKKVISYYVEDPIRNFTK